MNKYIALLALGVSVDARKHHRKHQQLHTQKLNNQVLQQEIEELRQSYAELEKRFEGLEKNVKKQSLVQSPFGLAGAGGPAQPSPQPFVRGEKQWMDNAQNIGNWGENQMEIANARIPYQSTAQIESSAAPNKFGLAGAGGPAQPSPQPFVRGEKQWMDNAQNIGNWGENQMEIANARIPYWSTVQLESEAAPNKYGLGGPKGPAQPSPQPFVRGEKQWMDNAQNIGNWGENQMEIANARIPYWSTLQLDADIKSEGPTPNKYGLGGLGGPAQPSPQPFVRGEKQWMDNAQNIGNWGENQMEIANARIPYWSTLQLDADIKTDAAPNLYGLGGPKGPAQPSPQPFVRGEKQWMDNAQNIGNWGENQMEIANARIPYWSTLVQTNSKDFTDDYEKDVDMNILYEKDVQTTTPEKVAEYQEVPLSQHL